MTGHAPPAVRPVVTGVGVLSAAGTGLDALTDAAALGKTAFTTVTRFDVSARRTTRAALLAEPVPLADAVLAAVDQACRQAGLPAGRGGDGPDGDGRAAADREGMPVLLALHSDLHTRAVTAAGAAGATAAWGTAGVTRVYTGACVAAGTAVDDDAAQVAAGGAASELGGARKVVEAGGVGAVEGGRAL
ncbi:hypothetical protein ACFVXQ_16995, partial [Kitasatospora sp. NPDC058263]